MPPQHVDVNVHPTKREVHFLHEDQLLEQLYLHVSQTLRGANDRRSFQVQSVSSSQAWLSSQAVSAPVSVPLRPRRSSRERDREEEESEAFLSPPETDIAYAAEEQSLLRDDSIDVDLDALDDGEIDMTAPCAPTPIAAATPTRTTTTAPAALFSPPLRDREGERDTERSTQSHTRPQSLHSFSFSSSSSLPPLHPFSSSATKRRLEETPVASSQPLSKKLTPNKFVRTDYTAQKIASFFAPLSPANTQTVSSSFVPLPPAGTDEKEREKGESEREVEQEEGDIVLCGICSVDAAGCACCGEPARVLSSQNALSRTASASSNATASLRELVMTSCAYLSVGKLIEDVYTHKDAVLERVLKQHIFVGAIDAHFSLVQFDTKLLVVEHRLLLLQLFFQLCVFRFAESDVLRLARPVHVEQCIEEALMTQEREGQEREFDFCAERDGSPREIAHKAARRLLSQAEMLAEYFNIAIDSEGRLTALPQLIPITQRTEPSQTQTQTSAFAPQPQFLGVFLLLLATETDWESEEQCFRDIALRIAEFYSKLSADENNLLTAESRACLESLLFPAMRKYLVPSKSITANAGVVEVTSLEKLYKIFERC